MHPKNKNVATKSIAKYQNETKHDDQNKKNQRHEMKNM